MNMKARTKKFQGRRYELISLEALIEMEEEAGDSEWFDRDWEGMVAEAIDDEAWIKYNEIDHPALEIEVARVLHK
jgi:hypothetical protein